MLRIIMKRPASRTARPGRIRWAPEAAVVLLLGGLAACSSFKTFQIESQPPERRLFIDGKADDWAGRLFVVGGQKVSLGFLNDRDSLYICLRTDDGAVERQLLRSGLTVWFDPRGGRKKALGIKYPVGLSSREQRMWKGEEPDEAEEPGEVGGNLTDIEICRPGSSEPEILDIADIEGFELQAVTSGSSLLYEIRLPLAPAGRAAVGVGAPPGGTVGIGFETGKFDLNNLPRGPGGRNGGTGGMPPVGGYGGRGGAMRPGRISPNDPEITEDLKIWAVVRLSPDGRPLPAQVQTPSE